MPRGDTQPAARPARKASAAAKADAADAARRRQRGAAASATSAASAPAAPSTPVPPGSLPPDLQPLSGLDALFLQFESAEMPMHVGSLSLLELPAGFRGDFSVEVKRLIGARLHLAEAFTRRLLPMPLNLANPAWLRCEDIDLDHHVRRVTLPRPGTQVQLEACVARLHAQPLDRSRPLWQLTVIDGLGGALRGHVGYYAKVHHAAIDGQAGVALAQAMLDLTPVPRAVPPAPRRRAVVEPGTAQRLALAARESARQLRELARLLPAAAGLVGGSLRGASSPAGADRARRDGAPLLAPRTPLSVAISAERAFSTASLPLAQVKAVARALEVSLNDVVLATCSGALRRWLAQHGGVPRKPLAAGVPFTLRDSGDGSARNRVSIMRAALATHLASPAARLREIHASTALGKAVTGRLRGLVPTDYPSLGSAWIAGALGWLAGAIGHRLPAGTHLPSLAPVAISNVPGPPQTLYVAGARVVHYWPASIVVHGLALNITVQSYAQWLDIGLTACRAAVPDVARFGAYLAASFDELQALAGTAANAQAAAPSPADAPATAEPAPRGKGVAQRLPHADHSQGVARGNPAARSARASPLRKSGSSGSAAGRATTSRTPARDASVGVPIAETPSSRRPQPPRMAAARGTARTRRG